MDSIVDRISGPSAGSSSSSTSAPTVETTETTGLYLIMHGSASDADTDPSTGILAELVAKMIQKRNIKFRKINLAACHSAKVPRRGQAALDKFCDELTGLVQQKDKLTDMMVCGYNPEVTTLFCAGPKSKAEISPDSWFQSKRKTTILDRSLEQEIDDLEKNPQGSVVRNVIVTRPRQQETWGPTHPHVSKESRFSDAWNKLWTDTMQKNEQKRAQSLAGKPLCPQDGSIVFSQLLAYVQEYKRVKKFNGNSFVEGSIHEYTDNVHLKGMLTVLQKYIDANLTPTLKLTP